MPEIRVNINGAEITGNETQTILDAARTAGIQIPTLCHDDRVHSVGSCGVCVVEIEGFPRLVRACSTLIADGMIIKTESKRALGARRTALELMLSDHDGDCRPPCVVACPGKTDCQGYVGLIANKEYGQALELIKERLPLPASIGRVCPHPCEAECRRKLVEEPISIAQLKFFVADIDLKKNAVFSPEIMEPTGKSVVIIGGGPGGLSGAYFLRAGGHEVTVIDQMPEMGGMLRYGIPEYRLPKAVVDDEVNVIKSMGVKMKNSVKIGDKDTESSIKLDTLRKNYDAVVIAIGAWSSAKLRCKGEELSGVLGGIDFLRDAMTKADLIKGKKVAVVGGGNTAMDACRTCIRLGAESVKNIYRRTRDEMPAEDIEIVEATEEGVEFKYLVNPIEILGDKKGQVNKMRLQKMELGEPDSSGRRSPVTIPGAEEEIDVDIVIMAVGQNVDAAGFSGVDLTKRGTISADEATFRTNLDGVFAIGDATNKGADIAIAAIGEAKEAARVISGYLLGEDIKYKAPYLVERQIGAEEFEDKARIRREKMRHLGTKERSDNFNEVMHGYSEDEAVREAKRCLECGCHDYFECKLIELANKVNVDPKNIRGEKHNRVKHMDDSHANIHRNPDKCIVCGLCTRVCDEVMGVTALGLVGRGFDTIVKPALGAPLTETDCVSCGQCIAVCPTGALGEKQICHKPVPVRENTAHTVCAFCGVGCENVLTSKGDMILRSVPDVSVNEKALLCRDGRFGYTEAESKKRLIAPMIRKDGVLVEVGLEEALGFVNENMCGYMGNNDKEKIDILVSDKITNEDLGAVVAYSKSVLLTDNVFSFNSVRNAMNDTFGINCSTGTFAELHNADVILLVGIDIREEFQIAGIRIKQAVERGAKLIVINSKKTYADEFAKFSLTGEDSVNLLRQFAKALLDLDANRKVDLKGFSEFKDLLSNITVSDDIKAAAELFFRARKAMTVFSQSNTAYDVSLLAAQIAAIRGNIESPRNGVIQLMPNVNSQGLANFSVKGIEDFCKKNSATNKAKALLVFGGEQFEIPSGLEFLCVFGSHMTDAMKKADAVIPLASLSESEGTVTTSENLTKKVRSARKPALRLGNAEVLALLAKKAGVRLKGRK